MDTSDVPRSCTLNDRILLAQSQADNAKDAASELLLEYKSLVLMKARRFYLLGGDNDDLIQEGMIGLYNAIMNYREGTNASFESYASSCIENQLLSAVRAANRNKHMPLNSSLSLDAPEMNEENGDAKLWNMLSDPEQNPEEQFTKKKQAEELYQQAKNLLSTRECAVFELYLQGLGYREIAEKLDTSDKSIDNALQRIKKKIGELAHMD